MEVRVAQALGREAIDVRGVDVGAVAAEVGEAEVVDEDDDDVGRVFTGMRAVRPRRRGLFEGAADDAVELLAGELLVRLHGSQPPVSSEYELSKSSCRTRASALSVTTRNAFDSFRAL